MIGDQFLALFSQKMMLVKRNCTLTSRIKDFSLESDRSRLCVLRHVHTESFLAKRGKQDVTETCYQMLLSENMFTSSFVIQTTDLAV